MEGSGGKWQWVAGGGAILLFCILLLFRLGVPGKIVEISHQDVIDAASKAEPKMTMIIKDLLRELKTL